MSTTIPFLVLAVLGLLVAIKDPRFNVSYLIVWSVLLVAFSNPYAVPVPWAGLIDFVTVVSMLFIPGSIFAGMLLAFGARRAGGRIEQRKGHLAIYWGVVLLAGLLGAVQTYNFLRLRPPAFYVQRGDIKAFQWISNNVRPDAKFLSPLAISLVQLVEPVDGGEWIAYFTGRAQAAPLGIYRSEKSSSSTYEADLRKLVHLQRVIDSGSAHRALRDEGVTHIFHGTKQSPLINTAQLDSSPFFRRVYDRDGVKIYELRT